MIYAVWNNKGGTGKTSLSFQLITRFAEIHPEQKILVIDSCPQANLSELLLGGLLGSGGSNLELLHNLPIRKSIGGYFQQRFPTPYAAPNIVPLNYISQPYQFNQNIPQNIDLLAGDQIVELQSNAISTLSNNQIPVTDTWIAVIDWLRDFVNQTNGCYNTVFIDSNPSFSIYTQIALSIADRLLVPVMADDSSRRATLNIFSLIYGANQSGSMYTQFAFSTKIRAASRTLPQIHLILKNRLTQYMGPASAYNSVLSSIENDIQNFMQYYPDIFTFTDIASGMVNIRDFQTTGVVSFAEGIPFSHLSTGRHNINGKETQIRPDYLQNCIDSIEDVVRRL